jgi:hypothetical protein
VRNLGGDEPIPEGMTLPDRRWTYWRLGPGRSALELHEAVSGGVGVELEILDGGGVTRTHAIWRVSTTGAILRWEVAGEA